MQSIQHTTWNEEINKAFFAGIDTIKSLSNSKKRKEAITALDTWLTTGSAEWQLSIPSEAKKTLLELIING